MIDVNMWGPMSTIHEALPGMIERGSGRIVNLSSQLAHVGWEDFAVYAATKAFLLALTKSIAKEVGRYGITVNAVCPGSIVTDMNRTSDPEGRARRAATEIPLRRMGDPADVAAAVAYLASPDGGFVTGQCIDVNGGLVTA
jgi:NAD(P)-dependent dehydrogenase (short-subunit alcohol dehydrogenase family)